MITANYYIKFINYYAIIIYKKKSKKSK